MEVKSGLLTHQAKVFHISLALVACCGKREGRKFAWAKWNWLGKPPENSRRTLTLRRGDEKEPMDGPALAQEG
jgi:hypothetical protein